MVMGDDIRALANLVLVSEHVFGFEVCPGKVEPLSFERRGNDRLWSWRVWRKGCMSRIFVLFIFSGLLGELTEDGHDDDLV